MLNRLLVASAVSGILIWTQSVARADLIYNWSFPTFTIAVTGHVSLPDIGCDGIPGCAANQIFVDSVPSSLPPDAIGMYDLLPFPNPNLFHITAGQVDSFDIRAIRNTSLFSFGLSLSSEILTANALTASFPFPPASASSFPTFTPASVPGPVVGAGFPGLLIVAGGLVAWWRRKRLTSSPLAP